ncbi:hypothetical protein GCM10009430_00070 [Aquimarina litoralis]|uniref:Natural product n=1 Tax=Aquimarina litoralis TaxID=584605 RepID=A0ABP3TKL8_9FLAO
MKNLNKKLELSLKKTSIAKLNNLNSIKGGAAHFNFDDDDDPSGTDTWPVSRQVC